MSPTSRNIHHCLLAPSYAQCSAPWHAASAARSRDQEKLHEYLWDNSCPGHYFHPISLESLGRFINGATTFIRGVAHGASCVPPTFPATLLWCGVATPVACSRRPLGSKRPVRGLASSGSPLILPLLCTHDGWGRRGRAAWMSLPFLGPRSLRVSLFVRDRCFRRALVVPL
jgi:hypothetical protein